MKRTLTFLLCGAAGCYNGLETDAEPLPPAAEPDASGGDAGDSSGDDGEDVDDADLPTLVTRSGLRRLTVAEYDRALRDLIDDDSRPGAEFMPEDALLPFDNDYAEQSPSDTLVLAVEKLAIEAADRLLADSARLDALLGCDPSADGCLIDFIRDFGRRAFRRPLTDEEVAEFGTLSVLGAEAGDARVTAAAIVRTMLQDPNFIYRVEIGKPVEGTDDIVALSDWEMASRLSFFLWGTTPDDALLDVAADGGLSKASNVRDEAKRMVDDPRAREAVNRFHALWLGYSRFAIGGLAEDMTDESDALVQRVVFDDDAPWLSLLTSTTTFITPTLAEHYGLPEPDGPQGWVDYGESGRGGILSHGTVLALGAKFDDTSPTVRGLQLRERLFCDVVEVPEDLEVDTDNPPGNGDPDACKWESYADHRNVALCAGCHAMLDGIGFGLENYDATGAFRLHDVGRPECDISGDGDMPGVGTFNGPGELGQLIAEQGQVRDCAVQQLVRYVSGRSELDELDEAFVDDLAERIGDEPLHLRDLMVDIAASDAFRFRTLAEGE